MVLEGNFHAQCGKERGPGAVGASPATMDEDASRLNPAAAGDLERPRLLRFVPWSARTFPCSGNAVRNKGASLCGASMGSTDRNKIDLFDYVNRQYR
jgi:hypothetical protein